MDEERSGSQRDRTVRLRAERDGDDWRNLWASVDGEGKLRIKGQDLGPATSIVSSDGEYEWVHTIAAEHIGRLLVVLEASDDEDILDVLEEHYTGDRSYELERLLRESDVPVDRWVWSG